MKGPEQTCEELIHVWVSDQAPSCQGVGSPEPRWFDRKRVTHFDDGLGSIPGMALWLAPVCESKWNADILKFLEGIPWS